MAEDNFVLLSHILNQSTPSYGNRDTFNVKEKSQITAGDTANSSEWFLSVNHLGSHIDMPNHFFPHGKTISDYTPGEWVFNMVQLVDIPCSEA